jgi:hypothetical protein
VDANKAISYFFKTCAESGPSGCAIASAGSTEESVKAWVDKLVDVSYFYEDDVSAYTLCKGRLQLRVNWW